MRLINGASVPSSSDQSANTHKSQYQKFLLSCFVSLSVGLSGGPEPPGPELRLRPEPAPAHPLGSATDPGAGPSSWGATPAPGEMPAARACRGGTGVFAQPLGEGTATARHRQSGQTDASHPEHVTEPVRRGGTTSPPDGRPALTHVTLAVVSTVCGPWVCEPAWTHRGTHVAMTARTAPGGPSARASVLRSASPTPGPHPVSVPP